MTHTLVSNSATPVPGPYDGFDRMPLGGDWRSGRVSEYRQPVGVIGVISPWNFPLHLSNRSVAPAREEEAIRVANDTEYGLSSAVFRERRAGGAGCAATEGRHDPRKRPARQRFAELSIWRREEQRPRPLRRRLDHRGVHDGPLDQCSASGAAVPLLSKWLISGAYRLLLMRELADQAFSRAAGAPLVKVTACVCS